MPETPDTLDFLIYGLLSLVAVYGTYVITIALRFRTKNQESEVLEQLK